MTLSIYMGKLSVVKVIVFFGLLIFAIIYVVFDVKSKTNNDRINTSLSGLGYGKDVERKEKIQYRLICGLLGSGFILEAASQSAS